MNPENSDSTVLIVDDNVGNLALLVEQLLSQGFQLMVAESGESALERIHFRKPDIILLDVRMAGIDGYETCRRLKSSPDTAEIPVIFLTALSDADDKAQGFGAGGVDFIAKPMEIGEVLLRLRTHLALRHMQQALAQNNAALEQRVAARTAELQAEVARRTQSEAEKTTLLEVVRSQSRYLQFVNNEMVAQQSHQRLALAQEVGGQLTRDLARLREHMNALIWPLPADQFSQHLRSMEMLLDHAEAIVQRMAVNLQQPSPQEMTIQGNPLLKLSERERAVLLLLKEQHSYDDIAHLLSVTPSTVRTYRYRMMRKLGLRDPIELLLYAQKYNLAER